MSFQIFFNDGGAGLSSAKSTCAGDGIVAAAAGDGSVIYYEGDGNGGWIVAADAAGDDIVSAADSGGGSVADAAGDGIEVGCKGVSGGLGTGEYRALLL